MSMLRWAIRVYVSFVLFVVFVFGAVVGLKELVRLLAYASFPWVGEWFSTHTLLTASIAGLLAGQVPVDSRLTGEGWFRTKEGNNFEGLKLDALRPWTWLIVTPISVLAVAALYFEESQSVYSSLTLSGLYSELVARNCSYVQANKYWFDNFCNVQLVILAPWVASIGYSIAPAIRKRGFKALALFRNSNERIGSQQEHRENFKKADSE